LLLINSLLFTEDAQAAYALLKSAAWVMFQQRFFVGMAV